MQMNMNREENVDFNQQMKLTRNTASIEQALSDM